MGVGIVEIFSLALCQSITDWGSRSPDSWVGAPEAQGKGINNAPLDIMFCYAPFPTTVERQPKTKLLPPE